MSSAKRWPVLLTLFCIPARAWEEEVVVRDERPVAAAIELLLERFRVPIAYEDPPYLYRGPLPVQERTPPRCHPRAAWRESQHAADPPARQTPRHIVELINTDTSFDAELTTARSGNPTQKSPVATKRGQLPDANSPASMKETGDSTAALGIPC